jgi:ABC-type polysaccharide/polyol phosphate transport system ATPase subunit
VTDGGAPANARPVIRVRDVHKDFKLYRRRETTLKEVVLRRRRGVYERFPALDGVSFDVPAGQVLGIVGRNGSGKSTVLKLLARILTPNGGTIETEGRVAAMLEVGAGFHPEYTAVENIFLSGAIYGLRQADLERRVDAILAFSELERFAGNAVKTYSSGMYARLGFAIAMNVDADILLIDEVLAVGDKSFQARCLDRMLEFRDAGKTIVLVTHDLHAIESVCDRALWIDAGKLVGDGQPRQVVGAYVDAVNRSDEEWGVRMRPEQVDPLAHAPLNPAVPIVLEQMTFEGEDGVERDVFANGESIRVRVHYVANDHVRAPICEIKVERHDGTVVTTASNIIGGRPFGEVWQGTGYFEWRIEDLPLTPGTYHFTPSLIDQTGAHVLDVHPRWHQIRVHEGAYRERAGVVALRSSWSHEEVSIVIPATPSR